MFWNLLIVPQAEDISDDAIRIVILDNEVWHRAMRGVRAALSAAGVIPGMLAILANVGAFSLIDRPFVCRKDATVLFSQLR
jgi:hypothetical protein